MTFERNSKGNTLTDLVLEVQEFLEKSSSEVRRLFFQLALGEYCIFCGDYNEDELGVWLQCSCEPTNI